MLRAILIAIVVLIIVWIILLAVGFPYAGAIAVLAAILAFIGLMHDTRSTRL